MIKFGTMGFLIFLVREAMPAKPKRYIESEWS